MCKQDNYNCTRAHNFKARTTNRGKGLTVTLGRTLCGVPWSALCPPHACHSHGVWAHPPGSRIQQTIENSIRYRALSQHTPSDPLLAKEWRSSWKSFQKKKTHSLTSAHLGFRATMWAFTKLIFSCISATARGLVATSAGFELSTLLHPEVLHVQVPNSSDSGPVDHLHRCRAVYHHHQRQFQTLSE